MNVFGYVYQAVTGRSGKWPTLRAWHLRQYPECAACGRREMLNVHHVRPVSLFPGLELDRDNLLTLCEWPTMNCHLWIGHGGRWDRWNPHVAEDAAVFGHIIRNARE